MITRRCAHRQTVDSPPRAYAGGVANYPRTLQEPRASGGITYTQTCTRCGASRDVNANQGYREVSAWRKDDE